jgi:hypothetical protein
LAPKANRAFGFNWAIDFMSLLVSLSRQKKSSLPGVSISRRKIVFIRFIFAPKKSSLPGV